MLDSHSNWAYALFAIGGISLIWGIWPQLFNRVLPISKPNNTANFLEDIKSDLVNMHMIERGLATKKASEPCPPKTAMQIYDDFIALFGENIVTFVTSLIGEILANRDVDPLIEFFKKFSEILDNNKYGLKTELESNESYKALQLDLTIKKLKLKMRRKKKAITQKNIDRACLLTYGLNSSILLRGVLGSVPEAHGIIPAVIRTTLEGIETATDKSLTDMLNNLENEWKATIRGV